MKKLHIILLTMFLAHFTGCRNGDTTNTTTQTSNFFPYLWHLAYTDNEFTQTMQIDPDADIHIEDAWKLSRGKGVTIAIIDTNFEPSHEAISANVIDVYNADNNTTDVLNTSDEASHGNAVSGFIAASSPMTTYVGSAPEAKLVLIVQEYIDDAAGIRAFEHAKKQGAQIISNSWGTEDVSEAISHEMKYIKDQNITIFFASGNENANLDQPNLNDESELESVIGIGATNEYNDITTYSNYGSKIDLLAPGGEAIGVLGLDDSGAAGSGYSQYEFSNGYTLELNQNYAFVTGTSFSCPIAAGVGALMLSVNPSLTPDEIREIMIGTADKIGGNNADYDENGFDYFRSYGKINAANAVQRAKDLAQ